MIRRTGTGPSCRLAPARSIPPLRDLYGQERPCCAGFSLPGGGDLWPVAPARYIRVGLSEITGRCSRGQRVVFLTALRALPTAFLALPASSSPPPRVSVCGRPLARPASRFARPLISFALPSTRCIRSPMISLPGRLWHSPQCLPACDRFNMRPRRGQFSILIHRAHVRLRRHLTGRHDKSRDGTPGEGNQVQEVHISSRSPLPVSGLGKSGFLG